MSIPPPRTVIELGSGQGLAGMVACTRCQVKSFTFSDCHPQVLDLLSQNIKSNLSQCENAPSVSGEGPPAGSESTKPEPGTGRSVRDQFGGEGIETFEGKEDEIILDSVDLEVNPRFWDKDISHRIATLKSDQRVKICLLNWECVKERILDKLRSDIILAADVVYDSRITPALVYVLKCLLEKGTGDGSKPAAYIASTIRNEDTRDDFLIAMGSEGLSYSIVDPPKNQLFHYDRSVPIEILKITAN